jgi:hypothetical protein
MLFGCNGRKRAYGETRMLLRSVVLQAVYSVRSERRLGAAGVRPAVLLFREVLRYGEALRHLSSSHAASAWTSAKERHNVASPLQL